ncbi:MAG: prepilin-type N-terminal cleavage/methylation domain-containing protein [Gemmatimonadales bacterium]
MTKRRAFTLIEVMIAIVLTALIALLAYGSAQAGFDTADRLDDYHSGAESQALMRGLITDGLRHLSDAPSGGPATFRSARTATGSELSFVSRGISSPLGAGSLWFVKISSSSMGIELRADPLEDSIAAPIYAVVKGVRLIDVKSLRPDDSGEWVHEWESPRQVPEAVEISYASERSSNPPSLIVAVSGAVRR